MISLDVTSAGKRKDPPIGFEQAVPGTLVMFTLLVMFTSGGVSLLVERRQGILRRLASSPMSRGAVVLGKWGARVHSDSSRFCLRWRPERSCSR